MSLHDKAEKNVVWLVVLTLVTVSVGGIVELVPLYTIDSTIEPVDGVRPYSPLELYGRDIYIREGCYNCHSQMIRPLRDEVERYGPYSLAAESMYDHPFQWGSKRTGPDLARVGGRYSDEWHEIHLIDPRAVVPTSNMPGYPWLDETPVDIDKTVASMKVLQSLGHPYTDEQIANAADSLKDKTLLDALVAYLQDLGTAMPRGYP